MANKSLRHRLAAHVLHSRTDGKAITDAARRAWLESFEDKVDPDCEFSVRGGMDEGRVSLGFSPLSVG